MAMRVIVVRDDGARVGQVPDIERYQCVRHGPSKHLGTESAVQGAKARREPSGAGVAATHPFSKLSGATVRSVESASSPTANAARRGGDSTLLLRFALLNLLALGLLAAAWWEGLVAEVIAADQTNLTVLIGMVFAAGLCISAWRAAQIERDIDHHRVPTDRPSGTSVRALAEGMPNINALRLKLTHRIASVRYIANVLVLLGLIGTVLGFIIALSGVDPDAAGDVEGVAPMVSTLIRGMSTALYTTLVGSILNLWLSANYQLLASGTVELMGLWMERAEPSGKPRSARADA